MKTFRRLLCLLMAVSLLLGYVPLQARAATTASGTCGDNLTWELSEDGTLTISGTGAMANYSFGTSPWYSQIDSITRVVIEPGVTSVGWYAFFLGEEITEIIISDTVTSIGDSAFQNCSKLREVTIPASVTSIGGFAFSQSMDLDSVIFEGDAPSISSTAFRSVTATVSYPARNTTWTEAVRQSYGGTLTWEAVDNTCGEDLTWELSSDGTLTISGTGAMANYTSTSSPWYKNAKAITRIVVEPGVTTIGAWAFAFCTKVTEVSLPNTLTAIGEYSFTSCQMPQLTLHDGLTSIGIAAFQSCDKLKQINIPNGVTEIGDYTFYGCNNLESAIIPYSVTSIGVQAFQQCSALKKISIHPGITSIGNSAFAYCEGLEFVAFYMGAPTFGSDVFSGVETTVYYPEGNATWTEEVMQDYGGTISWEAVYGAGVFDENTSWVVDLDGVLTVSGQGTVPTYTNNTNHWNRVGRNITSIVIEEGFTAIAAEAFAVCSMATEVTIPETVTEIGKSAFVRCTNLRSISIPASVTVIGDSAFFECDSLNNVILAEGVTTIGQSAFYGCDSLSGIAIPDSVKVIKNGAFQNCSSLADVDLGNGVTEIGKNAFGSNSALTTVTIPASVTSMGSNAFCPCTNLKIVYFEGDAPTFGGSEFAASTLTAYYPANNPTWTAEAMQGCGSNVTWAVNPASCSHTWENACDDSCEVCGFIREAPHEMDETGLCGICGKDSVYPITGTCGENLTWELSREGTLTISGTGAMTQFASSSDVPWYERNTVITKVVIEQGVTSIGSYAFDGCAALAEIAVPDSVTSIGSYAFGNCTDLKTITFAGDAPSIGSEAFDNTHTTARYPAAKWTWTADVMQNYGGGITWEPYGDPHVHTEETIPGKAATCTESGLSDGVKCAECGAVLIDQEVLPALGHTEVVDPGKDADCVNTGLTEGKHCGTCGEVLSAQETVPALGHVVVTDDAVAPDCVNTGLTEGKHCETCGEAMPAQEVIPALGHTEVVDPGKDADCVNDGLTEGKHCETCGEVLTAQEEIPALGHTVDESGMCTVCGVDAVFPASGICGDNLTWELTREGVLTISGTGEMYEYDFWNTFPGWYDHFDSIQRVVVEEGVTSISYYVFAELGITEVTLPDSLTRIGGYAFWYTPLTSCHIGKNVTEIGENPFAECYDLLDLTVDPENPIYYMGEDEPGVMYAKTEGSENVELVLAMLNAELGDYVVSDEVTSIRPSAFDCCAKLTSVTIPSSVCSIGDYAFYLCENLQSVTMPESIDYLGTWAFDECYSLTDITLPANLTEIPEGLLYCCESLESIEIPEGVTHIGYAAFNKCSSLTKITIPASVTDIDDYAFADDTFQKVVFLGDAPDINQWAFDSTTATVYYPSGNDTWTEDVMRNYGGDLTWSDQMPFFWTVEDGVLTVSCDGRLPDTVNWKNPAPWYEDDQLRESITKIVVEEGVTYIGAQNFYGLWYVTDVTIPSTLEAVGESAFLEVENVQNVHITDLKAWCQIEFKNIWANPLSNEFPNYASLEEDLEENGKIPCYLMLNGEPVTDLVVPEGVTRIGSSTFNSYYCLNSVTMPDTVTEIGAYAFRNCWYLTDVQLSGNLESIDEYAFTCCYSLPEINLPDSLTTLGDRAFDCCFALAEITVPGNVSDFGESVFNNCDGLTSAVIAEGVRNLGEYMFYDCRNLAEVELPEGLEQIPDSPFRACTNLKEITIPESVTAIGSYAFAECESLTDITIPAGVTSLGNNVFEDCLNLDTITFLGDAPAFSSNTFKGAATVGIYPAGNETWTEVVMQRYGGGIGWIASDEDRGTAVIASGICGDNLTWEINGNYELTISGQGPMYNYSNRYDYSKDYRAPWYPYHTRVTAVTVGDGVTSIGQYAFYGFSYGVVPEETETYALRAADSAFTVTLPETLTEIGSYAFYYCTALTELTVPDSVQVISSSAFSGCENLETITLGSGLTTIGQSAFSGTSLESITIPAAVNSIGRFTLSQFKEVTFLGDAPAFDSHTFYGGAVTVNYPVGNETWESVVQKNYYGVITWNGTCMEHIPGEPVKENQVDSTCTEAGRYEEVTYCVNCGEEMSRESKELELAKHNCESVVTDPTCVEKGYTTYTCVDCGHSYVDDETPATGIHTYENGICTECADYMPVEDENDDGIYEIGNAGQLYWFVERVNMDQQTNMMVELTCDIIINETLEGSELLSWTPIQNYKGTFRGNGYSISGLYHDVATDYVGFFAVLYGTVENLTVKESYIRGNQYVGGIAADNHGTIRQCGFDGTVKSTYNASYAGGITGYNQADVGIIDGCTVSGEVIGKAYTGGIAGYNKYQISNCTNGAAVTGEAYTGGITGYSTDSISNCVNTGAVTGSGDYVGGIVGSNSYYIAGCSNSGKIQGKTNVGGITGTNMHSYNKSTFVIQCANTGNVSGTGRVGGIVGSASSFSDDICSTIRNCYNKGIISNSSNNGYCSGIVGYNSSRSQVICCFNSGSVSGNTNSGHTIVDYNSGVVTDCYYEGYGENDTLDGTTYKSTKKFISGEVAYLLNGGASGENVVWRQNIGTDAYPSFEGGIVYKNQTGGCTTNATFAYSNEDAEDQIVHTPGEAVKENETASSYDSVVYCTVCKEELSRETITSGPVQKPDVVIGNVGLVLKDYIGLQVAVNKKLMNGGTYDKAYYSYVQRNPDGTEAASGNLEFNMAVGNLVGTEFPVLAWSMADTFEITVFYEVDGVVYQGASITTSVKEQAMKRIGTADAATKAVCVAMLNYGANVQDYFNHSDAEAAYLANSELTEEQKTLPTFAELNLTGEVVMPDGDLKPANKGLNAKDKINVQFAVKNKDMSGYEVRYTIDGVEQPVITSDKFMNLTAGSNTLSGPSIAMTPRQMRSEIAIGFYDAETGEKVYGDIICSVEALAKANAGKATEQLTIAMMVYGDAAEARFGK